MHFFGGVLLKKKEGIRITFYILVYHIKKEKSTIVNFFYRKRRRFFCASKGMGSAKERAGALDAAIKKQTLSCKVTGTNYHGSLQADRLPKTDLHLQRKRACDPPS